MKPKKYLLITILFMCIGFATITASLIFNGELTVSLTDDNFTDSVYFSEAYITNGGTVTGINSQILHFETHDLEMINEESIIDFKIFNNSRAFDANITINCSKDGNSEYVSLTSLLNGKPLNYYTNDNPLFLEAGKDISGKITVKMIKSYIGDEHLPSEFECFLTAVAVGKTSYNTPIDNKCSIKHWEDNGKLYNLVANQSLGSDVCQGIDLNKSSNVKTANLDNAVKIEESDYVIDSNSTFVFDSNKNVWKSTHSEGAAYISLKVPSEDNYAICFKVNENASSEDQYGIMINNDTERTYLGSGNKDICYYLGQISANESIMVVSYIKSEINDHIEFSFYKNSVSISNGNGVYTVNSSINDQYPIYYYRGNISNNNVVFGDKCWKIVRTTETGGTKLIYNGEAYKYTIVPISLDDYDIQSNDTTNPYIFDESTKMWSSSNHDHSITSTFTTKVKSTGEYQINYIVSSEKNYDKVKIYINDTLLVTDSGENDNIISLGVINENSIIKVEYSKDGSVSKYDDNVSFSIGKKNKNSTLSCDNVKLDTVISTSTFHNEEDDNAYVGYMYGEAYNDNYKDTHNNVYSSNIKEVVDNWYKQFFSELTDKIEDTGYCNDRNMKNNLSDINYFSNLLEAELYQKGYGDANTLYSFASRFKNGRPYLKCNNNDNFTLASNSIGNKKLTYPVGLISADELIYAGYAFRTNSDSYINSGTSFFTMTPFVFLNYEALVLEIDNSGFLDVTNVEASRGVRPVISLNNNQIISSGTGSVTDPYMIN